VSGFRGQLQGQSLLRNAFLTVYLQVPCRPGPRFADAITAQFAAPGGSATTSAISTAEQPEARSGASGRSGGTTMEGEQYLLRGVAILRLCGERITSVRFYLDDVDTNASERTAAE
jgi:hypothetical protein